MNSKSLSLEHIIRPSNLESGAPVLIMLHGFGSDENDLFSFSGEIDPRFFVISVKAPYSMMPFGNAWYAIHFDAPQGKWTDTEQAIKSRDLIKTFIAEAIEAYDLDPGQVTLLGFSQGTILSYAVALTYPYLIKNVVGLSGYVNTDLMPDQPDLQDYKHLDFYCSHGSVDQVIPVDWARKSKTVLDELNIKYVYSEFPVGHGVAPQNFYEFNTWLNDRI